MTNLTDPQKAALKSVFIRMMNLDEELRPLGDKAIATGDLEDELNGRSYSGILFNLSLTSDAACLALGIDIGPGLDPHMTDPDKIIARGEMLIDVGTDMLFDLRHLFAGAQL